MHTPLMLTQEKIRENKPPIPVSPRRPNRSRHATWHDIILQLARGSRTVTARKGRDLIVAGNRHRTLYINRDGWLSRYKVLHTGGRQIVDFILPGEIFGLEACLFRQALYSVVAVTESSLSVVPFDTLQEALERAPFLAQALFWSAACQAAILGERLIDTARRSAYARVSHLLLELFVRLERHGLTEQTSFHMPLTQELIADALGLTTVHVNRTLRSLREDRLIAFDGKRITLCDFDRLCLICDFEKSYLGESALPALNEAPGAAITG